MSTYKNRIYDVLKRPHKVLAKVNYHRYLSNRKEPANTISEMNPPSIGLKPEDILDSARQRRGIRKLASRLRLRNKS